MGEHKYDSDQQYREESDKKKLGRPLDDTAPQHRIAQKVIELAGKEEYQRPNGKPKPTTIRDSIYRHHPEIAGELSERQLYTRIRKALKKHNMQ